MDRSKRSTRSTREELPSLKTREEIQEDLRQMIAQLKGFGLGLQAERLERVCEAIDPYANPKLEGVLSEIQRPDTWPTKELSLWMAARLMEAAEIIHELMGDAEITGSEKALRKARSWLKSMGL